MDSVSDLPDAALEYLRRRRHLLVRLERVAGALRRWDAWEANARRAPRLRWVHCDHAGLNRSARPEVFQRGLLVTSSAGRSSPVLAEHAILFMLALAYRLSAFLEAQRAHRWGIPGQDDLRGLFGRTVGIVGLGNTGSELAVRCQALGMRVLGYRRRAVPPRRGSTASTAPPAGRRWSPCWGRATSWCWPCPSRTPPTT